MKLTLDPIGTWPFLEAPTPLGTVYFHAFQGSWKDTPWGTYAAILSPGEAPQEGEEVLEVEGHRLAYDPADVSREGLERAFQAYLKGELWSYHLPSLGLSDGPFPSLAEAVEAAQKELAPYVRQR